MINNKLPETKTQAELARCPGKRHNAVLQKQAGIGTPPTCANTPGQCSDTTAIVQAVLAQTVHQVENVGAFLHQAQEQCKQN
jgi:hypothetical protein